MISLSVKSPLLQNISSVAQLCLTLCDPMGCSMPGFPVHHQTYLTLQTYFDPKPREVNSRSSAGVGFWMDKASPLHNQQLGIRGVPEHTTPGHRFITSKPMQCLLLLMHDAFFVQLDYIFKILFIFGCDGSWLLHQLFLVAQRRGYSSLQCAGFSLK